MMSKLHGIPFWKYDGRGGARGEPCNPANAWREFFCILIH